MRYYASAGLMVVCFVVGCSAAERPEAVTNSSAAATGASAHSKHREMQIACNVCHGPHRGIFSFGEVTLPRGTSTVGGLFVPSSATEPATCTVECHFPFGGTPRTIAWNTPGPLRCDSCHENVRVSGPVQSSHPSFISEEGLSCGTCHETSQHLSGNLSIAGGANELCLSCHRGVGRTIDDVAPPLISAYQDPDAGDWHGDRAGSGFGEGLVAPYSRAEPALACTGCHSPHGSANPYLFASTVNGRPLGDASISKAGVGAESLCSACHQENRHLGCTTDGCHSADPMPAGNPCFYCHSHNGIVNFVLPSWDGHPNSTRNDCTHCHDNGWAPSTAPLVPLALAEGPSVTTTETTATIRWKTNAPATAYVEYGLETPGLVVGNPQASSWQHQITLSDLAAKAGYVFRIRSTDKYKNTIKSALYQFATKGAAGQPSDDDGTGTAPMLYSVPDALFSLTENVTVVEIEFSWDLWVGGTGSEEYEIQISTHADFSDFFAVQKLPAISWIVSFPVTPAPGVTYYWRVRASNAAATSPWAATESFTVYSFDPWG